MYRAVIVWCLCVAGVFAPEDSLAADALDARVTIAFSNAAAADVMRPSPRRGTESGGGVRRDAAGHHHAHQRRLGTALNAVCENALCTWRLAAR